MQNYRHKLGRAIEKSQRHQVQRNAMVGQASVRSKSSGIGSKEEHATKHTLAYRDHSASKCWSWAKEKKDSNDEQSRERAAGGKRSTNDKGGEGGWKHDWYKIDQYEREEMKHQEGKAERQWCGGGGKEIKES